MELREPVRKRRVRQKVQQPLPLIYNDKGELTIFTCHLSFLGTCILDPEEIAAVSSMGFFGKGSLSRNRPNFGKTVFGSPAILRQRQHDRRNKWLENVRKLSTQEIFIDPDENQSKDKLEKNSTIPEAEVLDKSMEEVLPESPIAMDDESNNEISQQRENQVLVIPDSDEKESEDEDYLKTIKPTIENEGFPVGESLHLTFEETFFLVYGLGCLRVIDFTGKIMDVRETWEHFCKESNNFVEKYVVYHYFRSKAWVVKPALKFGGDFLLYKNGPSFYHSSYIVIIDSDGKINWNDIFGLQRLSEATSKEIMVVQVQWPNSAKNSDLANPEMLAQFSVREILLRRWLHKKNQVFSQSDDEDEDSL